MQRVKIFYRYVLLHYFDMKRSATETYRIMSRIYGGKCPSERTYRKWFFLFKSGDFSVEDKERPGQPMKFDYFELQALLVVDRIQTLKQLSES